MFPHQYPSYTTCQISKNPILGRCMVPYSR
jgi:hypothetical protein